MESPVRICVLWLCAGLVMNSGTNAEWKTNGELPAAIHYSSLTAPSPSLCHAAIHSPYKIKMFVFKIIGG